MPEQKTILVAEDENDIREMYTVALSNKGYRVLQAENGKEAINHLEESSTSIDLILMDIVMPGMDGFEALEKISKEERFNKIPIIISTNLDNVDDKREALAMGAKEYFVKSQHTPSELIEIIHRVLGE